MDMPIFGEASISHRTSFPSIIGMGVKQWGGLQFYVREKADLAVGDEIRNVGTYVNIVQDHLEPFIEARHPRRCIFQQSGLQLILPNVQETALSRQR